MEIKITALSIDLIPSLVPFAIQASPEINFPWVSIAVVVLILALLAFIFFLLQELGKQQRRIERKFDEKIKNLGFQVSHIEQRSNSDRETPSRPELPVTRKEGKEDKREVPVEVEQSSREIISDPQKKNPEEQSSPENVFYLASPDNEKAFFAPEATPVPDQNTLYVIERNTLKLYEKITEQAMRLAMNSFELQIKRVCDVINTKESHHSKIVMLEPGKVKRKDNDFSVTQKIKVKFE